MKRTFQSIMMACLIFFVIPVFSQQTNSLDIQQLVKEKGIEVYNRELELINEEGYRGIRLSRDEGEGIAWVKGLEFSNGTITFDVRGEDLKQHSFVGLALYGKDNDSFDAIYLRPFQFKEDNETLRSHGIQYISLPAFTWQVLRKNSPNKYEHAVDPAPDPNAWVKVRIVVKGKVISTYINDNTMPSLVVEKLTALDKGKIGFYVADTSGGDFANLTITTTN